MSRPDPTKLGRADSWDGVSAVVAGFDPSGFAAADNLNHLGASVVALDEVRSADQEEKAELLGVLGADIRLGEGVGAQLPPEVDVLVVSAGWRPGSPLLAQARARGVPVWGEVELAWRLRDLRAPAPWLAVAGTNGKTTTAQMLDSILRAAGLRSVVAGGAGLPLVEVVMDPEPYDVIAVELSGAQLHHTGSMSAESAVVLNVAQHHPDRHSSFEDYLADEARAYDQVQRACVYNVADERTRLLVEEADVVEGARAIGFTLGMPGVGMLGLVDDILADRAFIEERESSAAELCTLADLASAAPHFVADALAASALARAHGVPPSAVRDGLRAFRPDRHRAEHVATLGGVAWVDDSKATNPHAAQSSIQGYEQVVWVAGGLARGARFEELVQTVRDRLRGVVLLGRDRHVIAAALSRHAPDVPVIEMGDGETGDPMERVVDAAAGLARPGDTVLLAPGCAPTDMFDDYAARGDAFAAAVHRREH